MKILASILLLLMPMITVAQNYQSMNEEEMKKMMQQMQKMQACMENIDQSKMKVLEQRAYQIEEKIKSLCADGKRDEAQAKAISLGMEIANDPTMQEMRKCSEMMKGTMPMMPFMDEDKDYSNHHVCD